MTHLVIGDCPVGPSHPCLIIAEVAQNHDGSLGLAHAFIDAAARAGADAIKFQTHIAAAESTPAEPFRVAFSLQDASRYDYWKRLEFTGEEWAGLARHADQAGILFLSSPFSLEAADLLRRCGVRAWKVASGEACNHILLDHLLATKLPLLLSTGLTTMAEIRQTVGRIRRAGVDFAVMQCTSKYPTPPEDIGLDLLARFQAAFRCPVGLSDHSGTIFAGLAAVALGASLLEVHLTFSREMFGPDMPVSLTMAELRQLEEGVRFIERARSRPGDKDAQARELQDMRELFFKSVVARLPLTAGTILGPEHLSVKKPGTGLPPSALPRLIGREVLRDLGVDETIRPEDVRGGLGRAGTPGRSPARGSSREHDSGKRER